MRPLLLEDADQDEVQLVDQRAFLAQRLFGTAELDDEVDDEVTDALTLIARQHLPPRHDHIVQDLEAEELCLWVLRILQDLVDQVPCVRVLFELVERCLCGLLLFATTLVERPHGGIQLLNRHSHLCAVWETELVDSEEMAEGAEALATRAACCRDFESLNACMSKMASAKMDHAANHRSWARRSTPRRL